MNGPLIKESKIQYLDFFDCLIFSFKKLLGGKLANTQINTNCFKMNQRIKRSNVFLFYLFFFEFKKFLWGKYSQVLRFKINQIIKIINVFIIFIHKVLMGKPHRFTHKYTQLSN